MEVRMNGRSNGYDGERHLWANVYSIALLEVNPSRRQDSSRQIRDHDKGCGSGKVAESRARTKALEDALKVLRILEEYQHDRKTALGQVPELTLQLEHRGRFCCKIHARI
jgi:hypothetical protein